MKWKAIIYFGRLLNDQKSSQVHINTIYTDFGESPSREQMKALIKDDPNEIPSDIVSSVYDININEYDK